jgi:hypothetical protein
MHARACAPALHTALEISHRYDMHTNTHILSRPRLAVWLNPDEISHDEEELNKLRKQQVVRTHAHTQTRMGTYMYTLDSPKVCGCNLRRALLRFCGYPCAQKRCLCARVLLELEAESSLRAQIMPLPQNRLSQLHVHVCVYGTWALTPGLFACRQMTLRLRRTKGSLDSSTFPFVIGPVREPWGGNFTRADKKPAKKTRV